MKIVSPDSPNITSPTTEIVSNPKIGKAIDVWAIGITLYCFIFGSVPFIADNEFELFGVICKQKYDEIFFLYDR